MCGMDGSNDDAISIQLDLQVRLRMRFQRKKFEYGT